MTCSHPITVTLASHQVVCQDCGVLLRNDFDPAQMKAYADFNKEHIKYPYTRYKRFLNLVHSIVYGFESSTDRKMLHHLSEKKITCVDDIIQGMVHSNLVDKRYCSLRLFIKCFLPNYEFQDTIKHFQQHERQLLNTFKQLEFKLANTRRSFVNYRFTLDTLLYYFGLHEYRIFIKPLKCIKRLKQNIQVLNDCHILTGDKPFVIPETFLMSPRSLFRPLEDRVETPSQ